MKNIIKQVVNSMFPIVDEINELLDLLDRIESLKSIDYATHLLLKKKILSLKLNILLVNKSLTSINSTKATDAKKKIKLTEKSNKGKILGYVKKNPKARAKDVVDEFSILSERTVKRNLMELVRDGLLGKKSKKRSVFYSVIE
jgi:hypothetical protein